MNTSSIINYVKNNYIGIASVLVLAYIAYKIYSLFHEPTNEEMNEPNRTGTNYPAVPYNTVKTKNFNISEMICKDGRKVPNEYTGNALRLLTNLQVLRDYFGLPIFLNSGYRSPSHNKKVGGATDSAHMSAKAADIRIPGKTPKEVHTAILKLIAEGKMQDGGLSLYPTFVHYDVHTPRRW